MVYLLVWESPCTSHGYMSPNSGCSRPRVSSVRASTPVGYILCFILEANIVFRVCVLLVVMMAALVQLLSLCDNDKYKEISNQIEESMMMFIRTCYVGLLSVQPECTNIDYAGMCWEMDSRMEETNEDSKGKIAKQE